MDIFTTNGSRRGWCNVDPEEGYSHKVLIKEECDCKYDGLGGRFCEVPVESTCMNQCAGHGHCRGGFCQVKHYYCSRVWCVKFQNKEFLCYCVFSSVIMAGLE